MTRLPSIKMLIPIDQLWGEDIAVIEDQLYTDKAITNPQYAYALRAIIEQKKLEQKVSSCGYPTPGTQQAR